MAPKPRLYLYITRKWTLLEELNCSLAEGNDNTLEAMPKWAVDKFKLSYIPDKSTISRIRKNRSKINATSAAGDRKKALRLACPALDTALSDLIDDLYSGRMASFERAIEGKATESLAGVNTALAADQQVSLNISANWPDGFKKRHRVRAFDSQGVSGDADEAAIEQQLPAIK